VKRESKHPEAPRTEIGDDIKGFYNYMMAPNIRHKVNMIEVKFKDKTSNIFIFKIFKSFQIIL
jgi:hypothetical protein